MINTSFWTLIRALNSEMLLFFLAQIRSYDSVKLLLSS